MALSPVKRPLTITPMRKRKARISLSPIKPPKLVAHGLQRQRSMPLDKLSLKDTPSPSLVPLPTSALEFTEFSFWNSKGGFNYDIPREAFEAYMKEAFGVVEVQYNQPFLYLFCEVDKIPSEDQRPFTIAGAVAIWLDVDIWWVITFGEPGSLGCAKVPEQVRYGLNEASPNMPSDDIILYLVNFIFRGCIAITVIGPELVVELPYMADPEDNGIRLGNYPSHLDGCGFCIRYSNGPLPTTKRRKYAIKLDPTSLQDLVCDETDYVKLDGKFYPGSMLKSVNQDGTTYSSVTAGIMVENGLEKRLTCSFHTWEKQHVSFPQKLGQEDKEAQQIYSATQGEDPGTVVGFLKHRMGPSNIGLAKLHDGIKFENQFMDADIKPKVLVKSSDVRQGDRFFFDSFVTGPQEVVCLGRRVAISRGRRSGKSPLWVPQGHQDKLPADDVAYISLRQGVYATNAAVVKSGSTIRDSVCGSTLIRMHNMIEKDVDDGEYLKRGEACGMLHYADLQSLYGEKHSFIVYADSFDSLIEEGWVVADHT